MNKKRLLVILAVVLALGLNACQSNDDETHATSDPTTEVTTDATIFSTEAVTEPKETTTPTEATTEAPTAPPTETPTESITESEAKECKHDYKSTVVAPTKTAQGYTLYECKNCDYSYKGNYTDKLPSDETEPSHQHSYSSNVTAPTEDSSESQVEYPSCISLNGEHRWEEWFVIQEPAEATTGIAQRECSICYRVQTKEIPQLDPSHTHEFTTTIKEPTCYDYGYTTYACITCGYTYADHLTNQLGHEVTEWETIREPMDGDNGLVQGYCIRCGELQYKLLLTPDYTPPESVCNNHAYIEWVDGGNCRFELTRNYYCENCRTGFEEVIGPKEPDNHGFEVKSTGNDGSVIYKCIYCGYEYTESVSNGE